MFDEEAYTTVLANAYDVPFRVKNATNIMDTVKLYDEQFKRSMHYAKTLFVVQSSGTGKSRTFTEIGKHVFTLPICLRVPGTPGFPSSDVEVYKLLMDLKDNDRSLSAHAVIACFISAAHKTMHAWLEKHQKARDLGYVELLAWWHETMESPKKRKHRDMFFSEVVESVKKGVGFDFGEATNCKDYFDNEATKGLLDFIDGLNPDADKKSIVITYFDEAHNLDGRFWAVLRVLSGQQEDLRMWYAFMGTETKVDFFNPSKKHLTSLRLRDEAKRLIPPYFDLGFDLFVDVQLHIPSTKMGFLQSFEHLSKYGRPLWHSMLLRTDKKSMLEAAISKLLNGPVFNPDDSNHVLATLSHRLYLDTVFTSAEAIDLADHSVACHLRLLTGVEASSGKHSGKFYTAAFSEPVLTLAAIEAMYGSNPRGLWNTTIETLSHKLCDSGSVEKGLVGELAACTLLIIARDFTAPKNERNVPDVVVPVLLLDFLDNLFGNRTWAGSAQAQFQEAFRSVYVNFTHWTKTEESLPEQLPDQQLLSDLWACGAALRCAHNQESIDLFTVTYSGSIEEDDPFDPSLLSAVVMQIKHKSKGDSEAKSALRPVGVPRQDQPYLAILMELGTQSQFRSSRSRIKAVAWKKDDNISYENLVDELHAADTAWRNAKPKASKKRTKELEDTYRAKRDALAKYKRYVLSIRGSSTDPYGILSAVGIESAFRSLLEAVALAPGRMSSPFVSLESRRTEVTYEPELENSMVVDE